MRRTTYIRQHLTTPTYKDYVEALCHRNPSLLTLSNFLKDPRARLHGSRIAALDFHSGIHKPTPRRVPDVDCLFHELHGKAGSSLDPNLESYGQALQGRLLVLEDLTVSVIELLGSELDIDPLFFAMHLHTLHRTGTQHQIPDEAALPSRLRSKNYINISYQRPVICEGPSTSSGKWVRNSAVDRKLVLLRSTTIALAAHVASVITIRRNSGIWIGEFSPL